jgi:hypothetical protein
MRGRRGVSVLATVVANSLVLAGLLFWGWSIWTMLAALWLEVVIETPFLARRIGLALGSLAPADLATYLRPAKGLDGTSPDFGRQRLRQILVGDPPAKRPRDAARNFGFFWVAFLAFSGFFLAAIGFAFGMWEHPGASIAEAWPFDGVALLAIAVGVLFAELVTARLDRHAQPAMPDTSSYEQRIVLIFLIVILAGWILGLIGPAGRLIATAFVVMKTVADLRGGYLPETFAGIRT